jgi:hypothetical protein
MLDLQKVTQALSSLKHSQTSTAALSPQALTTLWHTLATDPRLPAILEAASINWLIPTWNAPLTTSYTASSLTTYQVLGIDGSQIYPDRHQGTDLFLINIGGIYLSYNTTSNAALFTQPYIMHPGIEDFHATVHSPELINLLRQLYEFNEAVHLSRIYFTQSASARAVFFDGSLILWQLEGKPQAIKNKLLQNSLQAFEHLYEQRIPYLGYISAPYSKELVNIMRLYALSNPELMIEDAQLNTLFDTDIVKLYIAPSCYTIPFASTSLILEDYPPHLRIHFIYLVTAHEVVRIEFPAWLASHIPEIMSIVVDQIKKGFGYPVACAQAHEQAVVKANDKELFYALWRHNNTKKAPTISAKLQKKKE